MCLKCNLQEIINTPTVNDGNFYYVYDLCYNSQNTMNMGAFISSYTLAIANLFLGNSRIEKEQRQNTIKR